ncbi:MAG: GNAT family N-acetyltransferase [Bacillota bacterium]|nr:GNAT family N-acetyltransferase [Bacillota bacterium]
METVIRIREYDTRDNEDVVDLILSIQQEEYGIPISKEDQPDLFQIESFYQNGNGNFWVAVFEDRVVGTIALIDIGNGQVALRKMFVKEEFRGKTLNTANLLLEKAKEWTREKNVKEIFLGTTLKFVAAQRFYEKNGFQLIEKEELPESFPIMQVDRKFYKYYVPS